MRVLQASQRVWILSICFFAGYGLLAGDSGLSSLPHPVHTWGPTPSGTELWELHPQPQLKISRIIYGDTVVPCYFAILILQTRSYAVFQRTIVHEKINCARHDGQL